MNSNNATATTVSPAADRYSKRSASPMSPEFRAAWDGAFNAVEALAKVSERADHTAIDRMLGGAFHSSPDTAAKLLGEVRDLAGSQCAFHAPFARVHQAVVELLRFY